MLFLLRNAVCTGVADGEKRLKSKYIGYEYVFAKMLQNENITIQYDFRYILDQASGEEFCQRNEAALQSIGYQSCGL